MANTDILYVLKVADNARTKQEIARRLMLDAAPTHVRLSVFAPLSNYGYVDGVSGAVLTVNDRGISVGVADRPEIPRDFISWKNVVYFADAADLAPETT